jgi:hypothetical protein
VRGHRERIRVHAGFERTERWDRRRRPRRWLVQMSENFAPLVETETPALPPVARILAGLREQQARILANWAVRVSTLPVFRAAPSLGLDELQRDMPELLDAALAAVEVSERDVDDRPLERARAVAAVHGLDRRRGGFSIALVLEEIHALRQEVWAALWRMMERAPSLLGALRDVERRISETFDSLSIAAAEAWANATQRN